jgi:hypothetical protein
MKVTITAVRMAGLASGMAIRVRIFSSEAPSRRADSNSSFGELHEELAEDEHCGGVDRERQDHAQVGVPELVAADDHHVQGDHQQLEGQQQDEQHGAEHHAPAAELQPGQRVAGQQPDHQGGQQHAAGEDARVEQGAGQVDGLVDVAQVVEGQVGRVRERP